MRRDEDRHADANLLDEVRERFAQYRSERRGPRDRCSDEIRKLVLTAVIAGHPRNTVAEAAGIDLSTISRWRRESGGTSPRRGRSKARELRVVGRTENRRATGFHTDAAPVACSVVIRFGRSVTIDLPAAALTETFLRTLAASAEGTP